MNRLCCGSESGQGGHRRISFNHAVRPLLLRQSRHCCRLMRGLSAAAYNSTVRAGRGVIFQFEIVIWIGSRLWRMVNLVAGPTQRGPLNVENLVRLTYRR
jgi:hypothetical protein